QGFFYAQPIPADAYEALEAGSGKEAEMIALSTVETLDNNAFWDPKSMDTLIFNSYVGGACIFEYQDGKVEVLRVNQKYAQALGGDMMTMEDALSMVWAEHMDEENRQIMLSCIERAMQTQDEENCEVMIGRLPGKPGFAHMHCSLRVIARTDTQQLVYCTVDNMTAQWQAEEKLRETAEQLQIIMENISGGVTAVYLENDIPQFLFANDRYCALLGYTKEQFFAEVSAVHDLILPEDRAAVVEQTIQASVDRLPRTCVYRAKRRDGSVIWLESNISVTTFPDIKETVQLTVTNDITAQQETIEEIGETSEQLRFLNEISRELLREGDLHEAINELLQKILDYFDGSRAYVFELDWAAQIGKNTYEVCAEGISSEMDKLQTVTFETMKPWIDAFEHQNHVQIEDVEALGEERAAERRLLLAQNIHAVTAVALQREGRLIGFIGVDDPKRKQAHVDRLEALGDYMAVVFMRRDIGRVD
ncbi:MAG: PAS domain-containing protein, partial [Clostridia bacterium]|nr:PAS domain-containing protein [Clostridia bacterium]